MKTICDSAVYARKSKGHLPGLYYLVFQKAYPEKEIIWEPYWAVQYLKKLICLFHTNYLDKPTTTFEAIDTTPLIAKPTIKSAANLAIKPAKQKQGQPANSSNKQVKKSCVWFLLFFWKMGKRSLAEVSYKFYQFRLIFKASLNNHRFLSLVLH